LEPGLPNISEKDIENMKKSYESNILEIGKLYKKINNGIKCIYLNMEQTDEGKKYLKEINPVLDSSMEEIIFKYFYKNIDEIINIVNENIKNKENEEKEKEKDKINDGNELKNIEEEKMNEAKDIKNIDEQKNIVNKERKRKG